MSGRTLFVTLISSGPNERPERGCQGIACVPQPRRTIVPKPRASVGSQSLQSHLEDGSVYRQDRPTIFGLVWCIRSSVVNRWVLYANPFLRFEQESGFLSFRKPSNNMVNYGYRTLEACPRKTLFAIMLTTSEHRGRQCNANRTMAQCALCTSLVSENTQTHS